jgi:hypothetical protein
VGENKKLGEMVANRQFKWEKFEKGKISFLCRGKMQRLKGKEVDFEGVFVL